MTVWYNVSVMANNGTAARLEFWTDVTKVTWFWEPDAEQGVKLTATKDGAEYAPNIMEISFAMEEWVEVFPTLDVEDGKDANGRFQKVTVGGGGLDSPPCGVYTFRYKTGRSAFGTWNGNDRKECQTEDYMESGEWTWSAESNGPRW